MTKTRRLLSLFFTLALCLTLFRPAPAAAADLYFTSLNDTVLPLTAEWHTDSTECLCSSTDAIPSETLLHSPKFRMHPSL